MNKHKTSLAMLAAAIGFYVVFGIIIPDAFYGSPEDTARPVQHATAAVGKILQKVSPFLAIMMGAYALARFVKELRG